jgi:hypothetical protein
MPFEPGVTSPPPEPFAHLARRRRSGLRIAGLLLVLPLLLLALSAALVPAAAVALERDPRLLARTIAWAAGWPEEAVSVGAFDASLRDWTFALRDLHVVPPKQSAPEVSIGAMTGSLPHPVPLWTGTLQLGRVVLVDLVVAARQQRPPPPLELVEGRPLTIAARHVDLASGTFRAPRDRHLPAVEITGIAGTVERFHWTPAWRNIHGVAVARAERMHIGAIELADVHAPAVTLDGRTAVFDDVTFRYGDTKGTASGRGTDLHGRAATEIWVVVADEPLAHAIETATGEPSPITGRASVDVTLRTGGELPPGGARFSGWVSVDHVAVHVREGLKPLQKLFVDVAPWFVLRDDGWIEAGLLEGRATFGRGWVEIHTLERPDDEHKTLQAWGSLRDGRVDLKVRIVPRKRHRDRRDGLGVTISGPAAHPTMRLAGRAELGDSPEVATR